MALLETGRGIWNVIEKFEEDPFEYPRKPGLTSKSKPMGDATFNASPSLGLMSPMATEEPQQPNIISSILAESSHPIALLFHFGFRTAAIFVYLFFPLLFSSSFILVFVLTTVLLSMDFWTVKNVTGRLLVGRRWWNDSAPDGTTIWTFEARPAGKYRANAVDSRLFWASLYGYTVIWVLLGLVALIGLGFSWFLVVAFALMMNITNLIGYLKCDQEARSSMMNGAVGGFISKKLASFFS
jgi:hypothetical protein